MSKTANQVITKALRRLNLIARNEQADGDIYAEALEDYQVFHNWGRAEYPRKWSWNYDAVDDRYWSHVAGVFAGELAMTLPVSESARQRAIANAAKSLTLLNQQFRHDKELKMPAFLARANGRYRNR